MTIRITRRVLLAGAAALPFATQTSAIRGQETSPESLDVPTYRGNAARTGEHPGPGPAGDLRALWQVRLGTVLSSSPSVIDTMVYIGSLAPGTREGGALHAVDGQTGIESWRLATAPGDGIFSSPAIDDGTVVAGSYDGIVIAADVSTGEEHWRFQAAGYFLSSPALVDGRAYLADGAGHLYALGADGGDELWRAEIGEGGDRAFATPAVVGKVVYCIDASRRAGDPSYLHAYDAATGEERWQFKPDRDVHLGGTAVVAGDVLYVATRESRVFAVDPLTGKEQEQYDVGGSRRTELAVVNGLLYVGTDDGVFHAVDLETGEERWSRQLSDEAVPISPPTVADGIVYAGDTAGGMHALDATTGDEQWSTQLGSVRSSPAVTGGVLYVGSNAGSLRAVGG
jgi:eukaryotic-like serine/threonine-protein kinase